jgi:hypothetical protein
MILYSQWTRVPLHIRAEIAQAFGISKTGPTHVQDNVVVNDGYKIADVENALTVERLQECVGSKSSDLTELWALLIAKFDPTVAQEPVAEDTSKTVEETMAQPEKQKVVIIEKPKRGRKPKVK